MPWRRVPCYRCFSRIQPAAVCTTTTSPLPGTPATSPTWQCGPQNPHSHGGWRQPLPRREPLHGLPGFRTERPWYPGGKLHSMAKQSGDTCGLTIITLYHWTHWVHHEHDDDAFVGCFISLQTHSKCVKLFFFNHNQPTKMWCMRWKMQSLSAIVLK